MRNTTGGLHSRISKNGARNVADVTGTSRLTDRDVAITSCCDRAAIPGHRDSCKSPSNKRERADSASMAASLAARADDGDIVDTQHLANPSNTLATKTAILQRGTHKIRIFMGARYGLEIIEAMSWAKRQKQPIVGSVFQSLEMSDSLPTVTSMVGDADDVDRIPDLERKARHFFLYPHNEHRFSTSTASALRKGPTRRRATWTR